MDAGVRYHTQGPLPPLPAGPGVPSLTGAVVPLNEPLNGGLYMNTPATARPTMGPSALPTKPTAYNDFFQRLLLRSGTGNRPRAVARHPVAQSYSSHYYEDPGPPT